jgi:hypothetical protein
MQLSTRFDRFAALLLLAQSTHRWSRAQLARALGRDATKLVPASGNPKLDLLVGVAGVLEWPVAQVIEFVWSEPGERAGERLPGSDAGPGEPRIGRGGAVAWWNDLADGVERAGGSAGAAIWHSHRVATAWTSRGRFVEATSVLHRALLTPDLEAETRLLLCTHLASAHLDLWHLEESIALAATVLDWFREPPRDRSTQRPEMQRLRALAASLLGHAHRRLIGERHGAAIDRHAQLAIEHLSAAAREFRWLHEDHGDAYDASLAQRCQGGILEAQATLGGDAVRVVDTIIEGLSTVVDPAEHPDPGMVEALGWWCVYGCNLALRHLTGARQQRALAILTNKIVEIGELQGNWSLLERGYTIEWFRRQRVDHFSEIDGDHLLDGEDLRFVTGLLGRFPHFVEIGTAMLGHAIGIEGLDASASG